MTDVFISYSRKDIAFARLLHQALLENELETWIDWQDIPPSADWLAEVFEAIEGADAFVFIISETSLASEICGIEIAHAFKHNKRLIPIVIKDVEAEKVPKELSTLNWIFFEDAGEKFAEAMEDLLTAITVDQAWVKGHTRFQNRALDWDRKDRDHGLLLRGSDLTEAESWLAGSAGKDPQPTALQTEFILKSREDATRRRRRLLFGVGAALVVAVGLGILAWTQRSEALEEGYQRATAQAQALAEADTRATAQAEAEFQREEADRQSIIALSQSLSLRAIEQQETQPDLAALLAAQAFKYDDNLQTRSSLLTVAQSNIELQRRFLKGHPEWVNTLEFSPDGTYLVSGGSSDDILLVKTGSWEQVGEIVNNKPVTGNWGGIQSVTFSPDGNTVAATAADAIVLWEVGEGGLSNPRELVLEGDYMVPPEIGESLDFSPDGTRLVSAGPDNSLLVWDMAAGQVVLEMTGGHKNPAVNILYSPDGSMIASASIDDQILLWDAVSGKLIHALSPENPEALEEGEIIGSRNIDFSPDGRLLAGGLSDGTIHIWDAASGAELLQPLEAHQSRVIALAISPDGSLIASSGDQGALSIWDLESGDRLYGPLTEHRKSIQSLAFSPDGSALVSGSMDGNIILWELSHGVLPDLHTGEILSLAVSPDGQLLASIADDNTIRFWDLAGMEANGQPIMNVEDTLQDLAFSPDGKTLVSYCGGICLWDVEERTLIRDWEAKIDLLPGPMVFNPAGDRIASSDWGGSIRLWDPENGSLIAELPHIYENEAFPLGFSQDGKSLLAVDILHSELLNWDLDSGETKALSLESSPPVGIFNQFNRDSTLLASVAASSTFSEIVVLDAVTGLALFEPLIGHTDSVIALAFSNDDQILASGGLDQTVRLWDISSGQSMGMPLIGHQDAVVDLVFSPDDQTLISASADGKIRLWNMDPAEWFRSACEIAGRNLTEKEWNTFITDQPYQETCPSDD